MAKINNKKRYKITPITAEDLLLGTQLTTGKTSNFQVEDLVDIVQERFNEVLIETITFGEDELEIIDKNVTLPNKLSQFENDLDLGQGGSKIEKIEFNGKNLPIINKKVVISSDISDLTDNEGILSILPEAVTRTEFNISRDKINKRIYEIEIETEKTKYYEVKYKTGFTQNTAFGEASLAKKGNEVFYKVFANKSTNVEVGDTVLTLQPELRPKSPEFIVGHGGNGAMVVWLMIEPATGAVKVQEFPTEGSVTTTNAIVMSGSFFIRE